MSRSRSLHSLWLAALATLIAVPAFAGPSITGVCPDGSMFIVKRAADIPCPQAKQVDPHDVPPIRPTYLPRPYGWQVFQNKQDPNNPYNLVDQARAIREGGAPIEDGAAPAPRTAPPAVGSAPRPEVRSAPAPEPQAPRAFALGADETRDLARIVSLSQGHRAAGFGSAEEPLVVELAHSRAFETRLRDHHGAALGPVVLLRVEARAPAEFHGNFTFVQGGGAFHPTHADPREFGLLDGALGRQVPGGGLLGYAVLPVGTDLTRELDVYWNDRLLSVVLAR